MTTDVTRLKGPVPAVLLASTGIVAVATEVALGDVQLRVAHDRELEAPSASAVDEAEKHQDGAHEHANVPLHVFTFP